MANDQSSTDRHEWMALSMWFGVLAATLFSTIYVVGNFQFGSEWILNLFNFLASGNALPGAEGTSIFIRIFLYASLVLFIALIYFLITSWMKLGSMLLEVLVHFSSESSGKGSVFSTMLYLPEMGDDEAEFDADEADGSMPGEILRNLGFAWVCVLIIHGLITLIPYFI